jgi:hypothetical protein
MTVFDLIQHLQTLPPDTKVVVRGYEEGYNDILQLNPVRIIRNIDAFWWYGEYEDSNDTEAIDAIELYGENRKPKDDMM